MRLPTATNRTVIIAAGVVSLMVLVVTLSKKPATHASADTLPLILSTQTPAEASTQPAGPKSTATTVLELFNPSDKALTNQLNDTNITQQIEQIMATSFVLANCNLISDDDYKRTYKAAIVYAQQNKLAPDQRSATMKVYTIAKSATATYTLIYSRTKCDDAKLPTITQQLKTWQAAYLPHDPRAAGLEPD